MSNSSQVCGPGTVSRGGQCVPVSAINDAGVVVGPCGHDTEWDADAGLCVGTGTGDGGVAVVGVRWTDFELVKPEAIAGLAHMQLPGLFRDGTIVMLLRALRVGPDALELHGGSGTKVTDSPLTYSFVESFAPASVHASLTGDAFLTTTAFEWNFPFVPGQPPLHIFNAVLGGTLDAEGLPSSTTPSMSGVYKGCFLADSSDPARPGAKQIFIEVLSTDLKSLLDSQGGVMDADCTDSGTTNGYLFEATWQASEKVVLVQPSPGDGGTPGG